MKRAMTQNWQPPARGPPGAGARRTMAGGPNSSLTPLRRAWCRQARSAASAAATTSGDCDTNPPPRTTALQAMEPTLPRPEGELYQIPHRIRALCRCSADVLEPLHASPGLKHDSKTDASVVMQHCALSVCGARLHRPQGYDGPRRAKMCAKEAHTGPVISSFLCLPSRK